MSGETFFTAGGTLRSDAPSYVERSADNDLLNLVLAGRLCYVLTTRQMGKSSLMTRTAHRLRERHVQTAIIDLTAIGTATLDEWYVSVLDDLAGQLGLVTDAEAWWFSQAALSPVRRFSKFMRDVISAECAGLVALFIDEVDSALKLPFSDDFFAAIRALFNPASPNLSVVLLGVAQPNDLIKAVDRTPFNVGERINLRELSSVAAHPVLVKGLPHVAPAAIERIFDWTDGHPYLTQKIALAMSAESAWTPAQVDELVHALFVTERARTTDSNIQFVAGRMTNSPNREALLRLYRQVLRGKRVLNDEASDLQRELKLYGLVKVGEGERLRVRNRVYATVFDAAWLREWLPHRRPLALMMVLLLSVLLIGSLAWNVRQQQQTEAELLALNLTQFAESADSSSRLNTLNRIIALDENSALNRFNALSQAEQIALFEQGDPVPAAALTALVYETANDTLLLEAMVQALGDTPLAIEIQSWLRARENVETGNDEQARIEYSVAIALNPDNSVTRYERALTHARLGEGAAAVEDLTWLYQFEEWRERVETVVGDSADIQTYLRENGGALADLVPTLTATQVAVAQRAPTSSATPIPPSPTATSSATPIAPPQTLSPTPLVAKLVTEPLPFEPTETFGTIVYTCFVVNIDQLCAIDATGENQRQLTFEETTDWYGSISADGDILFSSRRTNAFGIHRLTADGTALLTPPRNGDYAPELSPDGNEIVFTRAESDVQNVWIMGADGSVPFPLTDSDTLDALDPTWSPDGSEIAFALRLPNGEGYMPHIVGRNGKNLRQLNLPIDNIGGRSDWSPDGKWLLIYAGERGARNIYAAAVDGSEMRQLTTFGDNLAPAWSLDGNWIVFTSYRDGDNDLYVMRPDGSDVRQLTRNDSADWQPRWGR